MPQAIQTKFIPAGNVRGSRIKASCERGSMFVSYPHDLSDNDRHAYAAKQLIARFVQEDIKLYGTPADKNPWNRPFVSGGLPDGTEAHVFLD